jgi:1-aminocyclopropane-1-carboxylate deaminase
MGGYAKKNEELIHFMNELFQNHGIPTDIVYTGKLFYAFYQMLLKQVFKKDSSILIIHSGGLQGNRSIKNGILAF